MGGIVLEEALNLSSDRLLDDDDDNNNNNEIQLISTYKVLLKFIRNN